jgi:HEXXH motif-containing protein
VSTLVRVLRAGSADPAEADSVAVELSALLAFDLAWLGALPFDVTLERLPARLLSLLAGGAVDVPEGARRATFRSGAVVFDMPGQRERITLDLGAAARGDESPWLRRVYSAVTPEIVLALADNNPLAGVETHPDKEPPRVDLGAHPADAWTAALREALDLVAEGLPAMRADIDVLLQQIVPTGYDAERHLSCSYQENIGTIYLSLHPRAMTLAEALVHEVSHNKLNALFAVDPVIENGREELYVSPVRPDPRPLHGVLLAVHAFLPIACLYENLMELRSPIAAGPDFCRRFEAIVQVNREGASVLRAHARPTRLGQGLFAEIERWDAHFR